MTNSEYIRRKMAARYSGDPAGEQHSEEFILGQIRFHESGAEFYDQHDQAMLANWSRGMVADWRKKLEALRLKRTTGEGSIQ